MAPDSPWLISKTSVQWKILYHSLYGKQAMCKWHQTASRWLVMSTLHYCRQTTLQCDAHLIQPLIEEDHCHTECKAQIASDNRNVVEIKQCTILCKINSSASVIHSLRTSCVKNALKWNWVLFYVLSCRTEPGEGLHFFAFLCSRVGLIQTKYKCAVTALADGPRGVRWDWFWGEPTD